MPATLFERLRNHSSEARASGSNARAHRRSDSRFAHSDLIASILHNLERLLNSRQGQVEACPDYGLMDLTLIIAGFPDSELAAERAIQKCIERFEPRLTRVRVKRLEMPEQPLSLFFTIAASLASAPGGRTESFETVIGPSGAVRVEHR